MGESDLSDSIWAETTDGGLLAQLFGYEPTLHDARIREISATGDRLELGIEYEDRPEAGEKELRVHFSLVFIGGVEAEFSLEAFDICGFSLSRKMGRIRADIAYCDGQFGFACADGLDVRLEAVDPLRCEAPGRLKIC
jgi:hypothetical protein